MAHKKIIDGFLEDTSDFLSIYTLLFLSLYIFTVSL